MAKAPPDAPREPSEEVVRLAKPHTHAGRHMEPGDTLTVTADQKRWLEKLGVIGQENHDA
ncbi:hypothetical protein QYE80_27245 [Pseudomonas tohonis]|nr:hypothetical protein L682_11000 [Pseudomonas alcaligenes OT 69]MDN4148700.1 hypothetical protein [Pseudomonas tohonis]